MDGTAMNESELPGELGEANTNDLFETKEKNMPLTKAQAVRIAAYHSDYLIRHRFTQKGAWGNIYISHHYILPDQVWTFYALGNNDKDVTEEVLDRLSSANDLTLVLPLQSVSPKIFDTISTIEKGWSEKHKHHFNSSNHLSEPSQDSRVAVVKENYQPK
jgi:hypothetical protein